MEGNNKYSFKFKGWPWDGNPTVIFSKICGFHLKWDEMILEKNIANWAVNTIQLSRNKRHLDRARLMVAGLKNPIRRVT